MPAAGPALARRLMPMVSELRIVTKDRRLVRFGDVMNYAQRDLIEECGRQLAASGHIRVVILKARQMGLSTAVEAILFVLAFLRSRQQMLIVSHELPSSQHILTMCNTYWRTFPWREDFHTRYAGRKELSWVETESSIKVATAGSDDVGRSQTITALHASEVAFWPHPDELMTGLRQAIPNEGVTAIFVESTANGVGNYFHRLWRDAKAGRSEMVPKFYPWWEHPEYTAAHLQPGQAELYGVDERTLTAAERELRAMGVSDDRLVWRRWAIRNLNGGDLSMFDQEYPSSPGVAFVSTGRNVFPWERIKAHFGALDGSGARVPLAGERGRLAAFDGKIRLVPCGEFEGGALRVFVPPKDDGGWGKYIIGADPTHTDQGDYACAQVLNRRTLEQVAVYRRKCDPITFAQDLELLGRWYNDALIAAEKQGPGYATVGALARANYPNQWETEGVDSIRGQVRSKYGWSTNRQTKHQAVQTLLKMIVEDTVPLAGRGARDGAEFGLVLHDEDTAYEMRDYVSSPKGSGYENSDGSDYDDGVMALAIAVTVNEIEPQPSVYGADDAFATQTDGGWRTDPAWSRWGGEQEGEA